MGLRSRHKHPNRLYSVPVLARHWHGPSLQTSLPTCICIESISSKTQRSLKVTASWVPLARRKPHTPIFGVCHLLISPTLSCCLLSLPFCLPVTPTAITYDQKLSSPCLWAFAQDSPSVCEDATMLCLSGPHRGKCAHLLTLTNTSSPDCTLRRWLKRNLQRVSIATFQAPFASLENPPLLG